MLLVLIHPCSFFCLVVLSIFTRQVLMSPTVIVICLFLHSILLITLHMSCSSLLCYIHIGNFCVFLVDLTFFYHYITFFSVSANYLWFELYFDISITTPFFRLFAYFYSILLLLSCLYH